MIKAVSLALLVAIICTAYGQKRSLFGMGSNSKGQLGQNDFTRPLQLYSTLGGSPITQLCTIVSQQYSGQDVGFWRVVAINSAGAVYGWGNGVGGALLGLNNLYPTRSAVISVPTLIAQLPSAAKAITCGERHVIISTVSNGVYGFGENDVGQLATGNTVFAYNMTALPALNDYTKIWAVGTATFATDSVGNLFAVGANNWGQLGTIAGSVIVNMTLVSVPTTVSVGGSANITHITGSTEYTMYLTSNGDLYASGLDNSQYSRFGKNSTGTDIYPFYNFTLVIQGIGAVDTQLSSTIAISIDQTKVYGWGDNANSRLCLPQVQVGTKFVQVVPTLIPSLSDQPFKVIRSKLGTTHTMFITNNGSMYGCGDNTYNQLGADWSASGWSQAPSDVLPTQISESFVTANTILSTIPSATLLISPSNTLYGWGAPANLAFPQAFQKAIQINGTFNQGVETIASGYQYSVIGLPDGTFYGMGANAIHTTLSNITLDFYVPIKMPLLSTYNVSYLVVGGGQASLATAALPVYSDIFGLANLSTVANVNSFYGYGVNDLAQLAQGNNQSQYKYPVPIRPPVAANTTAPVLTYLKIDAGFAHGLALATDGVTPFMYVWGSNAQGQIALRTVVTRTTMLLVDSGVIDIAAGDYHSFYIKKATNKLTSISTYTLFGTGVNTAGQLGFGALQYSNTWLEVGAQINGTASPFANLTVSKVWTGTDQTWVLTNKGLYVMGDNTFGQLGLGANVTTATRQPILHPFTAFQTPDIVQVACAKNGGAHTVVITAKGDVYVMGRNDNGQLGLDDRVNRYVPTQIPRTTFSSDSGAVTDVVSASVGADHTLMIVGRKDCLNNCNGRGTCDTVTGQCACFSEYLGEDCNLYQCPTPDCNLRGSCDTSIGICVCSPSALYSGLSCEKRRCTLDCSGRGRCEATGVCKCDAGFGGLGCQTTANAYTIAASWALVVLLFVFYL